MHVQAARRLRDIAITQFINALNMFPPHAVCRHRIVGWRRKCIAPRQKCIGNIIGVGGFRKIVRRTDLDRRDRRRDRPVPGQNHDAAIGAPLAQRLDDVQPVAILKPQVDDRIYEFDEIPQLAHDFAQGRVGFFPVFRVNPE